MNDNEIFEKKDLYIYNHKLFSHCSFYNKNGELDEFFIEETNNICYGDVFIATVVKLNKSLNSLLLFYDENRKLGFMSTKNVDHYNINDKILVQVIREEQRNKGVMFSPIITIYTKYFKYYNKDNKYIIYKNNIYNEYIKNFYNKIEGSLIQTKNIDNYDFLIKDLQYIQNFITLINNVDKKSDIKLVYKSNKMLWELLRCPSINQINKIFINDNNLSDYEWLRDYCSNFQYYKYTKIDLDLLLNKQVSLKCGGYLLIDYTNNGILIDVNTGKSNNIDLINKEAAIEALKQIRLRNFGGLIFIDFLKSSNYKNIDEILHNNIHLDSKVLDILPINSLGVCNISRQTISGNIYSILMKESNFGFIKNSKYIHYQLDHLSSKNIKTNFLLAESINEIPHNYNITIDNNVVDIIPLD